MEYRVRVAGLTVTHLDVGGLVSVTVTDDTGAVLGSCSNETPAGAMRLAMLPGMLELALLLLAGDLPGAYGVTCQN